MDGRPVSVTYPAPTIVAGAPPVSFQCTPPSPSVAAIGSTAITCTATDAQLRTDSCTFNVTVVPPPRVSATTYVCFGDSMTFGVGAESVAPRFVPSPPGSYPADLQTLLSGRYTTQTIAVLDEGISGERVDAGLRRLPRVLSSERPDALLLLEGVNDLNATDGKAQPSVVRALRDMVRLARAQGVTVFLATLPPERPGAPRAFAPGAIDPTNDQIRAMASAEGAVLVDLNRDFNGEVDLLLGPDGLHPNAAGYQRMADSFFRAIKATLEEPGAPHPMRWAVHGR